MLIAAWKLDFIYQEANFEPWETTSEPDPQLKAKLLRLKSVSDRQRYHALAKEEALGERKPSELLRRMHSLVENMAIDNKFFKKVFLERLPTSVQTILTSGSNDLDISKLAKMVDRMMEVDRLSSPTIAQVSQPLTVSTSDLDELKTQIAQLSATVAALQLRQSAGPSRRFFGRNRRRSRSRPRTANLCWYHVNYDEKARRCVPPCAFKSTQGAPRPESKCGRALRQLYGPHLLRATPLEFLDHLVDSNGIRSLSSKVVTIRDFPLPTSKRQLQPFLGRVNSYRPFLPDCADTILPLTSLLSGYKRTFELAPAALTSFEQVKALLADATLLTHFHADAPISLMVDASNVAVGAVLQQSLSDSIVPSAFFSKKLSKAETRYSTFGLELFAVCLAVRHFRHLLEGREFTIFTDHKPLTFALNFHSDKLNPREIRHLEYISQFTSAIRHIDGSWNEMADALSRPSIAHFQLLPGIDLTEMAAEQRCVGSPCDEDLSGLQLQQLPLITDSGTILCDVSTPSHRPLVPPSPRRKVFSSLHNPSQSGSRATDKLGSERFVWPGMHKDLKAWTRACIACQRSKIQRHNKAPICTFPGPGARFSHVHLDIVGSLSLSNGCSYLLTCVDRFTRWPAAIPLPDIAAPTLPDLDCSAVEAVFGVTVRLPGEKISPTPRGAVEDPTNLLHRLHQFMQTLSPVPPRSSASPSYLEKDLATCSHVYLRCDRVRRPLEPPMTAHFGCSLEGRILSPFNANIVKRSTGPGGLSSCLNDDCLVAYEDGLSSLYGGVLRMLTLSDIFPSLRIGVHCSSRLRPPTKYVAVEQSPGLAFTLHPQAVVVPSQSHLPQHGEDTENAGRRTPAQGKS
nr:unnamed protein product [Spirometra erinaceieuropaei]